MQEFKIKITRRLKDLPKHFGIPNNCEQCTKFIALEPPSSLVYVTDGTCLGTHVFCCMKCAKIYEKRADNVG